MGTKAYAPSSDDRPFSLSLRDQILIEEALAPSFLILELGSSESSEDGSVSAVVAGEESFEADQGHEGVAERVRVEAAGPVAPRVGKA